MKITTLGTGGMYCMRNFHTNFLVQVPQNTDYMLVDCGTDIRMSLESLGISMRSIDAVYITHEHPDHAGGLSYLAYHSISRYPHEKKITLYADPELMSRLWHQMEPHCFLFNGLRRQLTSYFDLVTVTPGRVAMWQDIFLTVFPWTHVKGRDGSVQPKHLNLEMKSYGLTIRDSDNNIRIHCTGDLEPSMVPAFKTFVRDAANLVFVDCYTGTGYPGDPVHMTYADLAALPADIKEKLRLVHYGDEVLNYEGQTDHPIPSGYWLTQATKDGLRFAQIHDTYDSLKMRRVLDKAAKEQEHGRRSTGSNTTDGSNNASSRGSNEHSSEEA